MRVDHKNDAKWTKCGKSAYVNSRGHKIIKDPNSTLWIICNEDGSRMDFEYAAMAYHSSLSWAKHFYAVYEADGCV